jgi:hypothetical protein
MGEKLDTGGGSTVAQPTSKNKPKQLDKRALDMRCLQKDCENFIPDHHMKVMKMPSFQAPGCPQRAASAFGF